MSATMSGRDRLTTRGQEREIFLSGIGGQGVQLAAKMLATAAMRSGRHVLMFGTYGGEMRGGDTDALVVVGEEPLLTPPVIDHGWAAIVMHPKNWAAIRPKLRSNGFALINRSVFDAAPQFEGALLEINASHMAEAAGVPQAASMVAVGAFAAATGVVSLAALQAVAESVLPPYRRQFAASNCSALALGFATVPGLTSRAWHSLDSAA